jgi:hypothetical protein
MILIVLELWLLSAFPSSSGAWVSLLRASLPGLRELTRRLVCRNWTVIFGAIVRGLLTLSGVGFHC